MKHPRHLKLAIESMQRCPGACSGCMLGSGERKGSAALGIDLKTIGHNASLFTDRFLATPGNSDDASAVHLTQGDHLLLDESAIDELVSWAHLFTKGKLDLLVSTSAIGKTENIRQAVKRFQKASAEYGQELTLLVVFDPAKALNARFGETYRRNIDIILDAFGYIEPILNIGPDIPGNVAPREVSDFMQRHGFDEIDLGLFPTQARAGDYGTAWPSLVSWFQEVLAVARQEGHFTMSFVALIDTVRRETAALDVAQFTDWLGERLATQVYFDARGAIHPTFSGIFGNVLPMLPRFGFMPLVTGRQEALDAWHAACRRTARKVTTYYSRREPCLSCPHMKTCAGGGAILFERSLGHRMPATPECPSGIRPVLDDLAAA